MAPVLCRISRWSPVSAMKPLMWSPSLEVGPGLGYEALDAVRRVPRRGRPGQGRGLGLQLVVQAGLARAPQQGPDLAEGPRRSGRQLASSRLRRGGQVMRRNDPGDKPPLQCLVRVED